MTGYSRVSRRRWLVFAVVEHVEYGTPLSVHGPNPRNIALFNGFVVHMCLVAFPR